MTGQIVEGLRPQCVILQTREPPLRADRRARRRGLRIGQQVAVVGVPRPDLLSPCGAILVVSYVTARGDAEDPGTVCAAPGSSGAVRSVRAHPSRPRPR